MRISSPRVSQTPSAFRGDRDVQVPRAISTSVTVALRLLDDGAWLSVNDTRRVAVGELWRLADPAYCGCRPTEFAVEGFTDCGVVGRTVTVTAYGTCIACGTAETTTAVPVGRVHRGSFRPFARESAVLVPLDHRPRRE